MNQRKLLRYENRLAVSGAAIIAFGAWNVVKAAIFFIVTPLEDLSHFFDSPEMAQIDFSSIPEGTLDIIVLVGVLAALMISLLVRFYIGRAAIQDSRRIRRRRITYVVFAALASLSLVMGVITRLFFANENSVDWVKFYDVSVVSTIVDLTSLMALLELIVSAIIVRSQRKKLEVA